MTDVDGACVGVVFDVDTADPPRIKGGPGALAPAGWEVVGDAWGCPDPDAPRGVCDGMGAVGKGDVVEAAGAVCGACVALAGGSEVVTCATPCAPANASNTQLSLTSLAAVWVFIMLVVPRVRALRSDARPAPAVSQ